MVIFTELKVVAEPHSSIIVCHIVGSALRSVDWVEQECY